MKKIIFVVLLSAVITACGQQLRPPVSSLKPVGSAFTLVFEGLGTANFNASLSSITTQALTDQQAIVKPIRVVARGSMDYIPTGQPRSNGFRYVYAVLSVNSTATLENVSFLGVRSSSSIADTAISAAIRAPGGAAFTSAELETLALSVKPAQASNFDSNTQTIQPLPNTEDTVQYLPESALDYVPTGMNGLLPYGFTVLNSAGWRNLETTPNANRMIVSMKVPLATDPINDPYAFAFSAIPVTDSETRVTQTIEAQSKAGNAAVVARTSALGSNASITALPSKETNSPASTNTINALCSVRTAGSATSPTAFLINRTVTTSDLEPVIRVISQGQVLPTSVWVTADGGYYLPAQSISNTTKVQIIGNQLLAIELGDGTVTASACGSSITSSLKVINPNITVDAGFWHSLGIKSDNTVVAWGSNDVGETTVPNTLSNVISISAGIAHNLALKNDGTITAWGYNLDGQTSVPNGLNNIVAVAAGGFSSLALKDNGTVVGWGCNCSGQISIPEELTDVVAISVGFFHTLALKSNGTVLAWGNNDYNQTTIPTGLSNVIAISAGGVQNLVLKNDGSVVTWGTDGTDFTIPNTVSNIASIGTGSNFNVSLSATGSLSAWGDSNWQRLDVPSNLSNIITVTGGDEHGLALTADGSITAWGTNLYGQNTIPDISPLTFKLP